MTKDICLRGTDHEKTHRFRGELLAFDMHAWLDHSTRNLTCVEVYRAVFGNMQEVAEATVKSMRTTHWFRDGFEKGGAASSTKIESKHLVRDGDIAYESGFAEVAVVRNGKSITRGSRYLTVWQAQPDGQWKILRNVVLP